MPFSSSSTSADEWTVHDFALFSAWVRLSREDVVSVELTEVANGRVVSFDVTFRDQSPDPEAQLAALLDDFESSGLYVHREDTHATIAAFLTLVERAYIYEVPATIRSLN